MDGADRQRDVEDRMYGSFYIFSTARDSTSNHDRVSYVYQRSIIESSGEMVARWGLVLQRESCDAALVVG